MTSAPTPKPPFRKQFSQPARPAVAENQRPGCLTVVCLVLFFASSAWLLLAAIYSGERGRWYPAHLVAQALVVGVAAWGLWKMQKWGALLLGTVAVIINVLYFFVGLANVETSLIYVAVVGPAMYFYGRMR